MNFSFHIFGTPNNNYNQFPSGSNSELFREFVQDRQSNVQLIVYRKDHLIYYTYIHSGLLSKEGNEGAYLGMSIVFNGVCFSDVDGIFSLLEKIFYSMASKGEIIEHDKAGKIIYTVDKFIEKQEVIDGYRIFLQKYIEEQFSRKNIDYVEIDSTFTQSNLTIRTLSLNDDNSDIIDVMRKSQYIVFVSDNNVISKPDKSNKQSAKRHISKSWLVFILAGITIICVVVKYSYSSSKKENTLLINNSVTLEDICGSYSGKLLVNSIEIPAYLLVNKKKNSDTLSIYLKSTTNSYIYKAEYDIQSNALKVDDFDSVFVNMKDSVVCLSTNNKSNKFAKWNFKKNIFK